VGQRKITLGGRDGEKVKNLCSRAKVPLLGSYQTSVFLAVAGLRGSRKVNLLASQILVLSL